MMIEKIIDRRESNTSVVYTIAPEPGFPPFRVIINNLSRFKTNEQIIRVGNALRDLSGKNPELLSVKVTLQDELKEWDAEIPDSTDQR